MTTKSKEKLSLFWLARYRPYSMVICSGLMLVLSFPPFPFAFLSYFAFIPLLLVIDQTPSAVYEDPFWAFFKKLFVTPWRLLTRPLMLLIRRVFPALKAKQTALPPLIYQRKEISHNAQVFRYAYTAFLIWNFGCGYWLMMTALGADDMAETLTNFVAGLLANVLNPFLMVIPVYLYTKIRWRTGPALGGISFVLFWITFEWLHFNWDLSWSWMTLGHCMSLYPAAIQYMEYTGILGVSLQILSVNVLVYLLLHALGAQEQKRAWRLGAGATVLMVIPFLLNIVILNPDRAVFQSTGVMNVRVIQPNIDPYEKFERGSQEGQIALFADLIRSPGLDSIDLVILPETAIPGTWTDQIRTSKLIRPLWDIVEEYDLSLLTGLTEYRFFNPAQESIPASARPFTIGQTEGFVDGYNAAAMLIVGQSPSTYQKGKLVPMVERMPFLEHFSFLKAYKIDLAGGFSNYGKPDSIQALRTHEAIPLAPLICYESEYGNYVRSFVQKGAQMLVIITNDGWWQRSSGHIQHAHFTTLRAIETRRAVARSANTGISLFADNRGNIHQPTTFWTAAYIDEALPLYDSITFYVKWGDYLGYLCGGASLLIIMYWVMSMLSRRAVRMGAESSESVV